jgi:hypothetical protein
LALLEYLVEREAASAQNMNLGELKHVEKLDV